MYLYHFRCPRFDKMGMKVSRSGDEGILKVAVLIGLYIYWVGRVERAYYPVNKLINFYLQVAVFFFGFKSVEGTSRAVFLMYYVLVFLVFGFCYLYGEDGLLGYLFIWLLEILGWFHQWKEAADGGLACMYIKTKSIELRSIRCAMSRIGVSYEPPLTVWISQSLGVISPLAMMIITAMKTLIITIGG